MDFVLVYCMQTTIYDGLFLWGRKCCYIDIYMPEALNKWRECTDYHR